MENKEMTTAKVNNQVAAMDLVKIAQMLDLDKKLQAGVKIHDANGNALKPMDISERVAFKKAFDNLAVYCFGEEACAEGKFFFALDVKKEIDAKRLAFQNIGLNEVYSNEDFYANLNEYQIEVCEGGG